MFKETKRKGFNFYRSYYDVFNELPEKDKLQFIKALLDKQFLNIEPIDLSGMVKFAWVSQYNSIDQQVKGYKSKTKDPMQGGTQGGTQGGCLQGEEEVQEKEEVEYTKVDFLKDWNELRLKHFGKPSFLNVLRGEDLENFKDLVKDHKDAGVSSSDIREGFKFALVGLFKQQKLPNDITSMQSNPKHFLKHFNTYTTAYHDKNEHLYGKVKTENAL